MKRQRYRVTLLVEVETVHPNNSCDAGVVAAAVAERLNDCPPTIRGFGYLGHEPRVSVIESDAEQES